MKRLFKRSKLFARPLLASSPFPTPHSVLQLQDFALDATFFFPPNGNRNVGASPWRVEKSGGWVEKKLVGSLQ